MAQEKMKVFLTGPHAFTSVHNLRNLTLSSFLVGKGWELVCSAEKADAICAVELPVSRFHCPKNIPNSSTRGLVIIQEPSVVRPFHNNAKFVDRFASRFLVGRFSESRIVRWPALHLGQFQLSSKIEKLPRACMIASNKVSLIPGELYSLRRDVVDSCTNLDLFGHGWNSSWLTRSKQFVFEVYVGFISRQLANPLSRLQFFANVRSCLGPVKDKLSTNAKYKVSVVIENSNEYMSEKLLEAFAAGSIPVYVGPEVADFGIPPELVIQAKPDAQSVIEGISQALEMDYQGWADRCGEWLTPQVIESWSLYKFWSDVNDELNRIASGSRID